jgi:hypothetical protein
MTVNFNWELLDRLNSKVERAEKHIVDLCTEWDRFKIDAYGYSASDNLDSGERIWRLDRALPIPNTLSLITGDAVHGLRCALDHVIYRLAEVRCRKLPLPTRLYFPVGKDRADFIAALEAAAEHKSRKFGIVKRLGPEVGEAIKAIEPYEGGRGRTLWHIHQLDIIDKHRSLLTAALNNPTRSMTPNIIERYAKSLGVDGMYTPEEKSLIFQTDSSAPFPLNAGDILHTCPIAEANENMKFTFTLAFREPQALKGKPIAPTLYQAAHFIRDMTRTFCESGFLS